MIIVTYLVINFLILIYTYGYSEGVKKKLNWQDVAICMTLGLPIMLSILVKR